MISSSAKKEAGIDVSNGSGFLASYSITDFGKTPKNTNNRKNQLSRTVGIRGSLSVIANRLIAGLQALQNHSFHRSFRAFLDRLNYGSEFPVLYVRLLIPEFLGLSTFNDSVNDAYQILFDLMRQDDNRMTRYVNKSAERI